MTGFESSSSLLTVLLLLLFPISERNKNDNSFALELEMRGKFLSFNNYIKIFLASESRLMRMAFNTMIHSEVHLHIYTKYLRYSK
jgi:uncharacterized protein YjaZ